MTCSNSHGERHGFKVGDKVKVKLFGGQVGVITKITMRMHPRDDRAHVLVDGKSSGWYLYNLEHIPSEGYVEHDTKPSNPKDEIGSDKLPLHLWPTTATALGCVGMLNGALKYGRGNFREHGVRTTIYLDAVKRHLDAYIEGEEVDPDDGVPHLAAALAGIAIVVDAEAAGKLHDDRNYRGQGYRRLVDSLTSHVPRLKQKHAARKPKHYTIGDRQK